MTNRHWIHCEHARNQICSECYDKAIIQAEHKAMKYFMELLNVWADTYLSTAPAHASPISHRKD